MELVLGDANLSYCGGVVVNQCSGENIFEAAEGASYGLGNEIICQLNGIS